jgi:signal peptidase II
LVGLTLFLVALDQGTKWLVQQNLAVGEAWAPIPALSKVFTITHVRNTGVAFGQMPGLGWLFMVVNFAVLVGVFVYYPRIPAGEWQMRLAVILILAGGLGNVIDRLRTAAIFSQATGSIWQALSRAYVIDFFDIKIWPVWNIADMCAVGGAALLAWRLWQIEKAAAARETVAPDL